MVVEIPAHQRGHAALGVLGAAAEMRRHHQVFERQQVLAFVRLLVEDIERGVPAEAIYRDPAGYRTWDSVLRARDVYGQKRIVIVSQRFHLDRALFLARRAGIEAWGLEARDVDTPYSVFTELRRYPSALRAYYDVWTDAPASESGRKITIGVDPPG